MTSYEQYVEVMRFIESEFTAAPVLMFDEAVRIEPPYLKIKSYGVANEHCGPARKDVRGYSIYCYDINRGKADKLISDVMDTFTNSATPSKLEIVSLEYIGPVERLEDDLYEGVIVFNVSSTFNK